MDGVTLYRTVGGIYRVAHWKKGSGKRAKCKIKSTKDLNATKREEVLEEFDRRYPPSPFGNHRRILI